MSAEPAGAPATSAATPPLLRMAGISKSFPGVRALDAVDLEVAAGEVHALLGENGAGKSTLLKILSGAETPDSGTTTFDGKPLAASSPHDTQRLGIVTIYQEFNLVPSLSVAENVFIGREPMRLGLVDWRRMRGETRTITERLGLTIDPKVLISDLSVAEQQMVEIARALSMQSKLIVMDEPTSALSEGEVARLFDIMRGLKSAGLGVIFVTHRLEEVQQICDRFTVLRDGQRVDGGSVAATGIDAIVRMMVGRDVARHSARPVVARPGPAALTVERLTRRGTTRDPHATVIEDVSVEVRRGEILGIAGLVGAGRTELSRAIFGADPFDQGRILVDGEPVDIQSPMDAIRAGIGLVPEDRKQQALFLALAVRTNLTMAALGGITGWGGWIDERAEQGLVDKYRDMLNIRMSGPDQPVGNLSGGNQQKVVLARWLALEPKVLIVDEPTRGIDIAAKAEVHNLLADLAANGIAIIAISSELPEVMAISDRIVTMREGRITGSVDRADATPQRLMSLMTLNAAANAAA